MPAEQQDDFIQYLLYQNQISQQASYARLRRKEGPKEDDDYMEIQRQMKMDGGKAETYEQQLMMALGAESVEEAMQIASAAGIKAEDLPGFLAS